MNRRLVERDGTLYIRSGMSLSSEPTIVYNLYLVGRRQDYFDDPIPAEGLDVWESRITGAFVYSIRDWKREVTIFRFELPGDRKCDLVEKVAVPKPKTRQQVRWNNGRWEKLMAKGWVIA